MPSPAAAAAAAAASLTGGGALRSPLAAAAAAAAVSSLQINQLLVLRVKLRGDGEDIWKGMEGRE